MSETRTVDAEARADIKVLQHQVASLSDAVIRHMEDEERQRDRMENRLNIIWRRLNWLTFSMAGGAGAITAAEPLLAMAGVG